MILTLQVLGQTTLGFKLSISQILVSIGVCAAIEFVITLWRDGVIAWPASAILPGNSVAFILRANGTRHGDWWSLRGIHIFALAAVLSMLAKHLIKRAGRGHLFNPSNVGLVLTLVLMGPNFVFPQYLWWGQSRAGLIMALVVIVLGGIWILPKVGMVPMAASFLATFGAIVAVLAWSGRSFVAIWHTGPVEGLSYWLNVALSPEVLVFVFFMMSDPRTAPQPGPTRVLFGAGTAVIATALISNQDTEFGIKLAILSSLTVTCALVPSLERIITHPRPLLGRRPRPEPPAAYTHAMIAAGIVTVLALMGTAAAAHDERLIRLEGGDTSGFNPQ